MPVAHVFAQTNIGHDNELRALRLDRADGLLDDAVFSVRATRRLVLLARNSEEQHGLQSEVVRTLRFAGHFADRKLKNARHALDRLPRFQLLADKKRQDKIVRGEFRLPHEIADTLSASQASWPMNQFSHGPRLSVWFCGRKFGAGRIRPPGGFAVLD